MARPVANTLVLTLLFWCVNCRYLHRGADRALADRWLARDCTVTDQIKLEAQIRDRGERLETLFIKAFDNGPTQTALNNLLAGVELTYKQRQEQLRANETYGLSNEEIESLKSVSLSEEKALAKSEFDHGYRAAALKALGIINRPAGTQRLQRLASDAASPFQYLAKLALERKPQY